MSTIYITKEPMTKRAAKKLLREAGYAFLPHDTEYQQINGRRHLTFTRYGMNSPVEEMAEVLSCWSEHDPEFRQLFGTEEEELPTKNNSLLSS